MSDVRQAVIIHYKLVQPYHDRQLGMFQVYVLYEQSRNRGSNDTRLFPATPQLAVTF